MRARLAVAAAALVLLFSASGARAQAAGESQADALFKEGRSLFLAGNFSAACPKFAESLKLDPAPGTLMNLAECETKIGKLVGAKEHFQLAASGFPKADKRRQICADRASELDGRIAHLSVKLSDSAPAGSAVRRGDTTLAASDLGVSVATDPGELTFVVTAPGRRDKTTTLTLKDGETQALTLEVGEELPKDTANASSGATGSIYAAGSGGEGGGTLRTAGIVVGALGLASVAAGVVTGVLSMGYAQTVHQHCDLNNACDPTGLDAASSGNVTAPVSTITLIAGGVLVATGITLFVIGKPGKKEAPRASLVPLVTPQGAHATFALRF